MISKIVTNLFLKNNSLGKNVASIRNFSVTAVNCDIERGDIVKIQSLDDFKDKVINSKVPVVVDFFAT